MLKNLGWARDPVTAHTYNKHAAPVAPTTNQLPEHVCLVVLPSLGCMVNLNKNILVTLQKQTQRNSSQALLPRTESGLGSLRLLWVCPKPAQHAHTCTP